MSDGSEMFEWNLLYRLPSEQKMTVNLLILVWLAFMLPHFSAPVLLTVRILFIKLGNYFVVHLLEPSVKQCFIGNSLEINEARCTIRTFWGQGPSRSLPL